jgi:sorting nexin-25
MRDMLKSAIDDEHLISYARLVKTSLWPDGQFVQSQPPRTEEEKLFTKQAANEKLSTLVPGLIFVDPHLEFLIDGFSFDSIVAIAAHLIGPSTAKKGAKRMFAVFQNRTLNKHLVYSIFDELVQLLTNEEKS